MKYVLKAWLILFVFVAMVVSITACNIELKEMDGNEYFTSTEKERSVELVTEYFTQTLKDPNFVVTCINKDGEMQYTQKVKGTDSYTLYNNGLQVYAFKKDGYFYTAYISQQTDGEGVAREQHSYYCSDSTKKGYYSGSEFGTMEELYNSYYCAFMNDSTGAGVVKGLLEEDATFNCTTHLERISGFATSTLNFTYTSANTTVSITASAEENIVQNVRVSISDVNAEYNSDLSWTFAYGNASVSLPDVDAWDKEPNDQ